MFRKNNNYLAYLLRLWRENETAPWRASLEAPGLAEPRAFPNLVALLKFLEAQTGEQVLQDPGDKLDRAGPDG